MLIDAFLRFLSEMRLVFGPFHMNLLIVEAILLMILGLINNILVIYVSIAIGQMFNSHKVLGSFAAYIGISTLIQIIASVGFIILGILFDTTFNEISSLSKLILPITLAFTLISNVLFYAVTDLIFKKKLNLQ